MQGKLDFEIKQKDVCARTGTLRINGKTLETPTLMPVYNPNKPLISIDELRETFGVNVLMTNAYIILKNPELREQVLEQGIHKHLGFDGVIATDSGSFQLMAYGQVSTSNREIIEFEEKIGSDIGSFLDIPSLPDTYKKRAEAELNITLQRAEEAKNARFVVNAGIQGSTHLDLRARSAQHMGKDFELCAIGGIVRLMEEYRYSELVDIICTSKANLPANRPVHAFGLGHPMVFSLAAMLGCDLFDSAAYALYAQDLRYMTETGTKKLEKLDHLPCCCPVCSKYGLELKELDHQEQVKNIARHNLYVSFAEIRRIKQAIKEGSLWELVCMRARSHPLLFEALHRINDHRKQLAESDPITKKSPVYGTGLETMYRPEVINAQTRLQRVTSDNMVRIDPFGEVPAQIIDVYPFGSFFATQNPQWNNFAAYKVTDLEKLRAIMDYQFGKGAGELIEDNVRIKRSKKTKRIRWVYRKKELIAAVRASDHLIIPKGYLVEKLKEKFQYPLLRVVISDEAKEFVSAKKSVFAKFVTEIDPDLRANDEVLVVDKEDNLLRVGTLMLSPKEALEFTRGVAVKVR